MTKKRASLLLEINFFLLIVAMLCAGFSQGVITLWKNVDNVKDQFFLGRVSRDVLAILEYRLTYHTTFARLQEGEAGTIVHCSTLGGAKSVSFFCQKYPGTSDYGFYQNVQTMGRQPGINPLSPPDMGVTNFRIRRLASNMVKVSFTLTVLASGRNKDFRGILYLRNGVVV